jgi:hypothetical protein
MGYRESARPITVQVVPPRVERTPAIEPESMPFTIFVCCLSGTVLVILTGDVSAMLGAWVTTMIVGLSLGFFVRNTP